MKFPPNSKFLLAPLLLVLLGSSSAVQAADAKASKYYEDALIRYEKKDLDGAVIQLKNALQIDKSMLPVQMLLGKALLQNGDVAAAEVAFLEAIRLGVNRAEVAIPLGQAYMAQGKHRLIFEQPTFNVAGLPGSVQLQLQLLRASASADLGGAHPHPGAAVQRGGGGSRPRVGFCPGVCRSVVPKGFGSPRYG